MDLLGGMLKLDMHPEKTIEVMNKKAKAFQEAGIAAKLTKQDANDPGIRDIFQKMIAAGKSPSDLAPLNNFKQVK